MYDWETVENDPENKNYIAIATAKLTMDKVFQVDPDSIVSRQATEDDKKATRTLVNAKKEIERKQEELEKLNKDLAEAKVAEIAGV